MSFGIAQSKSIFTSKTFWGSLIGLIAVVFPTFFQHAVAAIGISDPGMLADKIVGFIGGAIAIYGRFAASQPVTMTGGPIVVSTAPMHVTEAPKNTVDPPDWMISKLPIPNAATPNSALKVPGFTVTTIVTPREDWPQLNDDLKK